MRKCAVIIGVNRTGKMQPLEAAVRGASRFYDWAIEQGFDASLFIDDEQPVTHQAIYDAITGYINAQEPYDQLLVFFSGHGILNSPLSEVWLLSGAPGNVNEAINLPASKMLATYCGIPHVVFISDACRSIPNDRQVLNVFGSAIFPNVVASNGKSVVDMMYAARAGHAAHEINEDRAVGNYQAIYTGCLLDGLKGKEPSIIKEILESRKRVRIVPAYELSKYLEIAVPRAAHQFDLLLEQYPDAEILSRLPQHLSRLDQYERYGARGSRRGGDSEVIADSAMKADEGRRGPKSVDIVYQQLLEDTKNNPAIQEEIVQTMEQLENAGRREVFDTGTGFTIIGDPEARPLVNERVVDFFQDQSGIHIRLYAQGHPGNSFPLKLSSQSILPLAILEGFIGTVLIQNGVVLNVNYTPSNDNPRYGYMITHGGELAKRRAMVATLANYGMFRIDANIKRVMRTASYIRHLKSIDPTLGLYASYAYAQANDFRDVLSVLGYMIDEREPVLFDVALLASIHDIGRVKELFHKKAGFPKTTKLDRMVDTAPFCPLLTQGWNFLPLSELFGNKRLLELRNYIVPGLWTTFRKGSEDLLKKLLK